MKPRWGNDFDAQAYYERTYDAEGATEDSLLEELEKERPGITEIIKAQREKAASVAAKATDNLTSQGGFQFTDQTWDPDRQEAHYNILESDITADKVANALPAEGEKPTLFVMGGRAASGKSTYIEKHAPPEVRDKINKAINVDNDRIKSKLGNPQYWPKDADTSKWPKWEGWNAAQFHEEATYLVNRELAVARELGTNVVLDVTMKSFGKPDSFDAVIDSFKQAGYRIEGHYIHTPPKEAAKRALRRSAGEGVNGRYVPASYVLGSTTNEASFGKAIPKFDHWQFIDHSKLGQYHVVAEGGTDKAPKWN
jgi:hypothetical protein